MDYGSRRNTSTNANVNTNSNTKDNPYHTTSQRSHSIHGGSRSGWDPDTGLYIVQRREPENYPEEKCCGRFSKKCCKIFWIVFVVILVIFIIGLALGLHFRQKSGEKSTEEEATTSKSKERLKCHCSLRTPGCGNDGTMFCEFGQECFGKQEPFDYRITCRPNPELYICKDETLGKVCWCDTPLCLKPASWPDGCKQQCKHGTKKKSGTG